MREQIKMRGTIQNEGAKIQLPQLFFSVERDIEFTNTYIISFPKSVCEASCFHLTPKHTCVLPRYRSASVL